MNWRVSHQCHPEACRLADAHYSRVRRGTGQMMPPGRQVVLLADHAVWGASWPYAHIKNVQARGWADAWLCTIFRREPECPHRASDLILEAVAVMRWKWGEPPADGLVTWVNAAKVQPTMVRGRPVVGWTFRKAGFVEEAPTRGGLVTLRLPPERMPPPACPDGGQMAFDLALEAAG